MVRDLKPDMKRYVPIVIDVFAGNCSIVFRPGIQTGRNPDHRPGVAFDGLSEGTAVTKDGKQMFGMGVISRTDAARLRDALTDFLNDFPPTDEEPRPRTPEEEAFAADIEETMQISRRIAAQDKRRMYGPQPGDRIIFASGPFGWGDIITVLGLIVLVFAFIVYISQGL